MKMLGATGKTSLATPAGVPGAYGLDARADARAVCVAARGSPSH